MSKQLLKEIKESGKETLLLFYADWCGNCKTVKPSLKRFVSLKELNYIEIDSDSENELQRILEVEYLPTLIHIKSACIKHQQQKNQYYQRRFANRWQIH